MRLLDRPEAAPLLHTPLVRELHYWLLAGRHGATIRRLGWPGSHIHRVGRAVAVLRREFAQPLPVEHLAALADMSPSSFHKNFRREYRRLFGRPPATDRAQSRAAVAS